MSGAVAFAAVLGLANTPTSGSPSLDGEFSSPPVVVWERTLPGAPVSAASHTELGAPLIHGDHIWVGSAGSNALYALNRYSGLVEFQYASNGPVQSAPVIDGEQLIFADAAGYTWCYSIGAEKEDWKHYGGAPVLSSPSIAEGVVFVSNVGNTVYALGQNDGILQWRHQQEADQNRKSRMELYGAPPPVIHGDEVLAGFHDGAVVGLSRATGERLWQRRVGEGRYPDLIGAPVVRKGDIIVAGFSEPLASLNVETQNMRWRVDAGGIHAAVVTDDSIYHGGSDGTLRAVDGATGSPHWKWESPGGGSLTQPILTDAGILVASAVDGLYLIDDDSGEQVWHLDPGYTLAGISASVATHGRQAVIVTNAGRIMSLVVPEKAADWARNQDKFPEGLHE